MIVVEFFLFRQGVSPFRAAAKSDIPLLLFPLSVLIAFQEDIMHTYSHGGIMPC